MMNLNNLGHPSDDDTRTVCLIGEVDDDSVRSVVESIIRLTDQDPKRPITLIINTIGGDIDSTFMLYDLMKFLKTPIHTLGLGRIMSAGCLLLAAGEKGHRLLGKNARLMYHAGYTESHGNIFQLKNELTEFERQERQYDELFAYETGLTLVEVEALYSKDGPTVDHFITPAKALELKIVDALI